MTMKKLIIVLAFLALSVVSASAQTYLTNTTTSAAVTVAANTIRVASATNIAAGGALYIDHELMQVTAVSGTTITVSRTQNPQQHGSGAVVYVATAAQKPIVFRQHEAAVQLAGLCVLTDQQYLPIFDTYTGDMYACRYSAAGATFRTWTVTNVQGFNGAGSIPTAWP
jgi:methionine-rich copper-binding protein CopC